MAKAKLIPGVLDTRENIVWFYDETGIDIDAVTKKSATYIDPTTERAVVFEGDLKPSFTGGLQGGTVARISFINNADQVMYVVDHLSLKAKQLDHLITSDFYDFFAKVHEGADTITGTSDPNFLNGYAGNDRITGKGGDDVIIGEAGNDRLTGGDGYDIFSFIGDFGKDVITDFNPDSDGTSQDFLEADPERVRDVIKSGHDTIIKFDHGNQITLLDVKPGHITPDDFQFQ